MMQAEQFVPPLASEGERAPAAGSRWTSEGETSWRRRWGIERIVEFAVFIGELLYWGRLGDDFASVSNKGGLLL